MRPRSRVEMHMFGSVGQGYGFPRGSVGTRELLSG